MVSDAGFAWISSARTDVGMVRKVNEDACLTREDDGLWAVADGMGGHAAGDVASRLIVEQLAGVDVSRPLSAVVTDIEARLAAVNDELRELASSRNISTIGSTVAALVLGHRYGVCLWVGDSRVYRVRDGHIEQLTQDHAFVEDLVEKGILSREDAIGHPQSNLVTRAVGAQEQLRLDMEIFELEHEDVFVLCSDGLDKEVNDEEIVDIVCREPPRRCGDELVEQALARGARDNVTVITVRVLDRQHRAPGASDDTSAHLRELAASDDEAPTERTDFGRLARRPLVGSATDDPVTVRRPAVRAGDQAVTVRPPAAGADDEAVTARHPAVGADDETVPVSDPAAGPDEPQVAARRPAPTLDDLEATVRRPAVPAEDTQATTASRPAPGVDDLEATVRRPAVRVDDQEVTARRPAVRVDDPEVTARRPAAPPDDDA